MSSSLRRRRDEELKEQEELRAKLEGPDPDGRPGMSHASGVIRMFLLRAALGLIAGGMFVGVYSLFSELPEPWNPSESWADIERPVSQLPQQFGSSMLAWCLTWVVRPLSARAMVLNDGIVNLPGIEEPIDISRDDSGVVSVEGELTIDVLYGQGLAHARDRLWQMECSRRTATGTLAQAFGPSFVQSDHVALTLDFIGLATLDWHGMDATDRAHLSAYVRGVNQFLQHPDTKRPSEFFITGLALPVSWSPIDVLAVTRLVSWQSSKGWQRQLTAHAVAGVSGETAPFDIGLGILESDPIPKKASAQKPKGSKRKSKPKGQVNNISPPPVSPRGQFASTVFAVSGRYTASGSPIVVSELHGAPSIPGAWMTMRLVVGGHGENHYNATGATYPGLPFVFSGTTPCVSWGMAVSGAFTSRTLVERRASSEQLAFERHGKMVPGTKRELDIEVNGRFDAVPIVIERGPNGPIMSSCLGLRGSDIAIDSPALMRSPLRLFQGLFLFGQARTPESFRRIARSINVPLWDITYGNIDNDIGTITTGQAYIWPNSPLFPEPGWEQGDPLPRTKQSLEDIVNPPTGFVIAANSLPTTLCGPHGGDGGSHGVATLGVCQRYWRLSHLLTKLCASTASDTRSSIVEDYGGVMAVDLVQLLGDTYNADAHALAKFIVRASGVDELEVEQNDSERLLGHLIDWDGRMNAESKGALALVILARHINLRLFDANSVAGPVRDVLLGNSWPHALAAPELSSGLSARLLQILENKHSPMLRVGGGVDTLLGLASKDATDFIVHHLGRDSDMWRWGDLHRVRYTHTLGNMGSLHTVLEKIPASPIGGDADTVLHAPYGFGSDVEAYFTLGTSLFRSVTDLSSGAPLAAYMTAPGQSGMQASLYYRNGAMSMHKWKFVTPFARNSTLIVVVPIRAGRRTRHGNDTNNDDDDDDDDDDDGDGGMHI